MLHLNRQAALASAATWLAWMAGMLVGGDVRDAASLAIAGAIGATIVGVGFAAASRSRALPPHSTAQRVRLALLALAAGAALGVANLAANGLIAAAHPAFRTLLGDRMAALPPLQGLVGSPIVEEIALRLFLMSVLAWVVGRVTTRAELAMTTGLVGSALIFGLLHLDRPMPDDATLANIYRAALLAKYTVAGAPLGWIFWRWGLPYAIVCHAAANAAHLVLQNRFF